MYRKGKDKKKIFFHELCKIFIAELDLVVDVVLQRGAVPPPLPELVLALVDGPHRAQPHRVHEARVTLAKLDLEILYRHFLFSSRGKWF